MQTLAGRSRTASAQGRLRAEHFIHLRCEVSAPDVIDSFAAFENDPRVRIASLMDHTPGPAPVHLARRLPRLLPGQERDDRCRARGPDRAAAGTGRDIRRTPTGRRSPRWRRRAASCSRATTMRPRTTSPKPSTHGVTLAEFPTTHEAAAASHAAGLKVLMGAPNIVRGGSHSGNIAAGDLVAAGLLDVLSSDYFPFSLIHATFIIGLADDGIGLPQGRRHGHQQPGRGSPASTTAARLPRASGPTSCRSASTITCRSSAPCGARACASCERRGRARAGGARDADPRRRAERRRQGFAHRLVPRPARRQCLPSSFPAASSPAP